ncbi:hypothetical protein [Paenibacillus polymyxa]|uniref:Uncharacterized protein n=1 Tax=Paenibacillus polymyxa TaxID=1406 RepID=A0A378Y254_PAEPO|nr:hypothetical protein [Paenibacillus polymyxa]SUA70387.1 Uncharacterised protein [Paenibacillus polymyxa]
MLKKTVMLIIASSFLFTLAVPIYVDGHIGGFQVFATHGGA